MSVSVIAGLATNLLQGSPELHGGTRLNKSSPATTETWIPETGVPVFVPHCLGHGQDRGELIMKLQFYLTRLVPGVILTY